MEGHCFLDLIGSGFQERIYRSICIRYRCRAGEHAAFAQAAGTRQKLCIVAAFVNYRILEVCFQRKVFTRTESGVWRKAGQVLYHVITIHIIEVRLLKNAAHTHQLLRHTGHMIFCERRGVRHIGIAHQGQLCGIGNTYQGAGYGMSFVIGIVQGILSVRILRNRFTVETG
ncbi:hypothetical protein D9M68_715950 [compost metagenome]